MQELSHKDWRLPSSFNLCWIPGREGWICYFLNRLFCKWCRSIYAIFYFLRWNRDLNWKQLRKVHLEPVYNFQIDNYIKLVVNMVNVTRDVIKSALDKNMMFLYMLWAFVLIVILEKRFGHKQIEHVCFSLRHWVYSLVGGLSVWWYVKVCKIVRL